MKKKHRKYTVRKETRKKVAGLTERAVSGALFALGAAFIQSFVKSVKLDINKPVSRPPGKLKVLTDKEFEQAVKEAAQHESKS